MWAPTLYREAWAIALVDSDQASLRRFGERACSMLCHSPSKRIGADAEAIRLTSDALVKYLIPVPKDVEALCPNRHTWLPSSVAGGDLGGRL